MRRTLFGIGATVAAVALTAAFVVAQSATAADQGQGPPPPVVQGQAPPPGPVGPGQQRGPRAGRGGRAMMGQGVEPARAGVGRGRAGGGLAALNLSDEQRATVTELERAMRDQAAPIEDELTFTRKTLHRELFADARDSSKIATLTSKLTTLEKQLLDLHVKQATAMADVLSAEQRETMRLREGRGFGPGPGRGVGRGGPGPR